MSLYDYREARKLWRAETPFYTLIMAAMYAADDINLQKLRSAWPEVWEELQARYRAPGDLLGGEKG